MPLSLDRRNCTCSRCIGWRAHGAQMSEPHPHGKDQDDDWPGHLKAERAQRRAIIQRERTSAPDDELVNYTGSPGQPVLPAMPEAQRTLGKTDGREVFAMEHPTLAVTAEEVRRLTDELEANRPQGYQLGDAEADVKGVCHGTTIGEAGEMPYTIVDPPADQVGDAVEVVFDDFQGAYMPTVVRPIIAKNPPDSEFVAMQKECMARIAEAYRLPRHLLESAALNDPTSYVTAQQIRDHLIAFFGGRRLCRRTSGHRSRRDLLVDQRKRGDILRGERRGVQGCFPGEDQRSDLGDRRLFRSLDRRGTEFGRRGI